MVMTTILEEKRRLRRILLDRRALFAADADRHAAASEAACGRVLGLPAWDGARTVALYAPFRGEVDTAPLFAVARKAGKSVMYPRCVEGSRGEPMLEWRVVTSPDRLVGGAYGIPEPDPECPLAGRVADFLVVPAVGLSDDGYRLGYGGGYYDRLLASPEWRGVAAVGLVFACQMDGAVPHGPWDMRLPVLVTEEGVICPK